MKLYRHYKNKPYKYIGEARHSETLDEVVIYEALYENKLGNIWVRPKQMFFESVEVNGKSVPRFKETLLTLEETTEISQTQIGTIAPLIEKALGQWDPKWFHSRLENHTSFHLVTAFLNNQAVGFKLGYELDKQEFYSWLGGVLPEFRGLGIASELMCAQHNWCRSQGYQKIQTKTQNRFREMFILNLKKGFEVIGCHDSDEGGFKIILEKRLT